MKLKKEFRIGTAAWSLPKDFAAAFPSEGTHLERYAKVLNAVEINSSFYKEHKPATYAKWASQTPDDFCFSVKLAKNFTHVQKMQIDPAIVSASLRGIAELGEKWKVLLVQLPPSLAFDKSVASRFFETLKKTYTRQIAFEPRHRSWLEPESVRLLQDFAISKVIADPETCPSEEPLKLTGENLVYMRLHGTPDIYKSRYDQDRIQNFFGMLDSANTKNAWCIFDNTTFGYATANALELQELAKKRTGNLDIRLPVQECVMGTSKLDVKTSARC